MRNKPRIRFKGFTEDWEQCKLGSLATVEMNKRIFKEQTTTKGDIPFYKIGTFGCDADSFISRDLFEEYKNKYPYPNIGDILISASGSIGRTVVYNGEDAYYQDSNIVWLNHNGKIDNSFLLQFYNQVKWAGLEGSTIKRLYNKNILETYIAVPKIEEQRLIGEFFKLVDSSITLHQRKLEKLKLAKKALLQKLFPKNGSQFPEIRFKGFTDAWEQCKLDELTISIGDGLHGTPKYDENGSYYFINGNNLVDSKVSVTAETKKVAFEALSNDDRRLDSTSILMSINGTIGTLARYNNENIMLGKSVAYITPKNINRDFLFYQLQGNVIQSYFYKNLTGTTIKNLGLGTIKNAIVMSTLSEEESKIGQFFYKLDQFITLHQRKLDKLQEMKKGLLQKMFV